MTDDYVVYRDDYTLITEHIDHRVALQVGRPPEDATPTIADARELRDSLSELLAGRIDEVDWDDV